MDPLALTDEQDFTEIKLEPPEEDNSIICIACNQIFTTFKDKVLHDFFQHAQVTSVMEEHIEIKNEDIKNEKPDDTTKLRKNGSKFKS